MRVRPLFDRILLVPVPAERTSAGGVITTMRPEAVPQRGVVAAVGPDVTSGVEVDDTVIYAKGKGENITIAGRGYVVVRDADLDAVIGAA